MKIISKSLLVARPAVLYVADIPVLWLPFIFQDMRSGRRSGIIPPRFGVTDIVRTSPDYVRSIDNLGYYFNINDYLDALVSYDWRSGTSNQEGDFGYNKLNGEFRYRWLNRFVSGGIRASYWTYSNGDRTIGFNWQHAQQFSQSSSLNMNLNYTSNTTVYQQDALTVAQALAAISSQLALTKKLGPFNITAGGSRSQYAGRDLVNQDFPNFSVTAQPINIAKWLAWTPTLQVDNNQAFNLDNNSIFRYFTDSVREIRQLEGQGEHAHDDGELLDAAPHRTLRAEQQLPLQRSAQRSADDRHAVRFQHRRPDRIAHVRELPQDAARLGHAVLAPGHSAGNVERRAVRLTHERGRQLRVSRAHDAHERRLGESVEARPDRHLRVADVLRLLPGLRTVLSTAPVDSAATCLSPTRRPRM